MEESWSKGEFICVCAEVRCEYSQGPFDPWKESY